MPDPAAPAPTPRALTSIVRTAFWTLVVLAFPGCLLTSLAYFVSRPAVLAQLSPFRVQYAVLLAGLGLFGLALRHFRWALLFLAFAAFNLWAVFYSTPPPSPSMAGTAPRAALKILLSNVLSSNPDPAPLLALIAAEKPDLVALLEINRRWENQLSAALGPDYPQATFRSREDNFGIALLSRIPTSDTRLEFLADAEVPSLSLTLALDGQPLRVLLTHPLPPGDTTSTALRDRHLAALNDWATTTRQPAAGKAMPVLILGDLNSTPWCPPLRHLLADAGLRPARCDHAWVAPTWPAPIPFLRIPLDHALLDSSLACTSYRVGPDIGSDHLPVILEVGLTKQGK